MKQRNSQLILLHIVPCIGKGFLSKNVYIDGGERQKMKRKK